VAGAAGARRRRRRQVRLPLSSHRGLRAAPASTTTGFHLQRGDADHGELAIDAGGLLPELDIFTWMASPTFSAETSRRMISGKSFGKHSFQRCMAFENAAKVPDAVGSPSVSTNLRVQLFSPPS
jgi:hypothetical protein